MVLSPRAIGIGVIIVIAATVAALGWRLSVEQPPAASATADQDRGQTPDFLPCLRESESYSCLQAAIEPVFAARGADETLKLLGEQVGGSPQAASLCHALTHDTGHAVWEQTQDVKQAFGLTPDNGYVCASGFYHGVIEAAVEKFPREELASMVPDLCTVFKKEDVPRSLHHFNCVHGLGHGLFALFGDKLSPALDACGELSDDWERDSCASGVFMQNVVNEYEPLGHRSDFRADDPLYPCNSVARPWQSACYFNHTSHLLILYQGDFAQVFEACRSIPEVQYRSLCFESGGRDAAGRLRPNDRQVIETCLLAKEGAGDCIYGAARDYVYFEHGRTMADQLCSLTPESIRQDCLEAIARDINSF